MRRGTRAILIFLLILVVVLWLASFRIGAVIHAHGNRRIYYVALYGGDLEAGWWRRSEGDILGLGVFYLNWIDKPPVRTSTFWNVHDEDVPALVSIVGQRELWWVPESAGRSPFRRVFVPIWILAIPLSIPLLFAARRQWRHWRRQKLIAGGICPRWGYDLRASPDRCPECGQAIAS